MFYITDDFKMCFPTFQAATDLHLLKYTMKINLLRQKSNPLIFHSAGGEAGDDGPSVQCQMSGPVSHVICWMFPVCRGGMLMVLVTPDPSLLTGKALRSTKRSVCCLSVKPVVMNGVGF